MDFAYPQAWRGNDEAPFHAKYDPGGSRHACVLGLGGLKDLRTHVSAAPRAECFSSQQKTSHPPRKH